MLRVSAEWSLKVISFNLPCPLEESVRISLIVLINSFMYVLHLHATVQVCRSVRTTLELVLPYLYIVPEIEPCYCRSVTLVRNDYPCISSAPLLVFF